jgi:thiol-disulfide isomerase/thioredoxin
MNKKAVILSLAILFVIAAAVLFLFMKKSSAPEDVSSHGTESAQPIQHERSEGSDKGVYTEYSEMAFTQAKTTRLIFFYAPWCPQCRELDASIKASSIPSGVTIFKIDYDSNQALRQKYGVTLQTTVVKVDAEGQGEKNYVAYEAPNFASVAKALLP